MDYSILAAWTREISPQGLIVESTHSSRDTMTLKFKSGDRLMLVLSSEGAFPMLNPPEAVAQGEKVWSLLNHAVWEEVSISPTDRVLTFRFSLTDIYQQYRSLLLIFECTPPKPNAILADNDQHLTVIDAFRKYTYADNPRRQILPRLPYQPAATSFKPVAADIRLPLALVSAKTGGTILCDTANAYLAAYYTDVLLAREEAQRFRQAIAHWQKELKKTRQKLSRQTDELHDADKAEYWRNCAETIKFHLQDITRGQTSLKAVNYFDPSLSEIDIPLLADKSPQQNLQLYLKKYHKAKRGKEVIEGNVSSTEQTIKHLENIIARLENGEYVDLPGKSGVAALGHKLDLMDRLLKLRISDEFEIVIGRKASENDFITTQLGRPHDWWFHTRIYRGSHILLRCFKKTSPPDELVSLCCSLAAWYSKARFSQNVPVDYTQVRYVRKPRRSAPGFVTYTEHRTVFADPMDLRSAREHLKP